MRILSIVGARPQIIKAAVLCRALPSINANGFINHKLVHTGQHYDEEMSGSFFEQLQIPTPDFSLNVGSASHAIQTAEMMKRLEPVLENEEPDWVILYGDTNSTLAGALVAIKLGLRLAHVEAGLRSYNRAIPEEHNRVVADHFSDLLFCPTPLAVQNLAKEGLAKRTILTGDVMYDAALIYRDIAEERADELAKRWHPGQFALSTVHRAGNTDDPQRLRVILETLDRISQEICPVVLPMHPRTRKRLADLGWMPQAVAILPPVTYLEMLLLEGRARFVITDSGGVQKEAYFLKKPCITMRTETEWEETLENGCNVLTDADAERIMAAARNARHAGPWTALYGDGDAATAIWKALLAGG